MEYTQGGRHFRDSISTFSVYVMNENADFLKIPIKLEGQFELGTALLHPIQTRMF